MKTEIEYEESVGRAEECLRSAQKELENCKAKPAGCVCDIAEWGCAPGPICDYFDPTLTRRTRGSVGDASTCVSATKMEVRGEAQG
jgi:hypothetical protein